jgi:hypothetical protein
MRVSHPDARVGHPDVDLVDRSDLVRGNFSRRDGSGRPVRVGRRRRLERAARSDRVGALRWLRRAGTSRPGHAARTGRNDWSRQPVGQRTASA